MSVVGTATPTAPDHASVSRSKSKSKHKFKSKSKSKSISEPGSGSRSGSGGYYPSLPPFPFNFHLLEVTVISAQDLQPAGRSMQTYAVAWINPSSKSRTRLDAIGYTDPSWNEKFVFRVEDAVLRSDTSFVSVEIYARGSVFRSDNLLGTARALISTLRPSLATQFHALQVRRPSSLRPQGILNIAVALLDGYAKSLPLYQDLNRSYNVREKTRIDSSKEKGRDASKRRPERKQSYKHKGSSKGWRCLNPATDSGEIQIKPIEAKPWVVKRPVPSKEKGGFVIGLTSQRLKNNHFMEMNSHDLDRSITRMGDLLRSSCVADSDWVSFLSYLNLFENKNFEEEVK